MINAECRDELLHELSLEELMFRRLFSVAVLMWLASTTTPQAHCDECLNTSSEASVAQDPEKARPNNALLDEILVWLSTNFDLPAITDRPAIEFVPKPTLAMIRAKNALLLRLLLTTRMPIDRW
jgi:hypothetical protein